MKNFFVTLISFFSIAQNINADVISNIQKYDMQLVGYLIKKGVIKYTPVTKQVELNDRSELYNEIRKSAETEISSKSLNCTGTGGDGL